MVEAVGRRGGEPWTASLVVRLPPAGEGAFEHYDLAGQARTQEAVAAAGVRTAAPCELEADPGWVGAPFLVMARIDGHIPGDLTVVDPWIDAAGPEGQAELHGRFLDVLAAIHRLDWRGAGLGEVLARRDLDAELDRWSAYLDWYADGEAAAPVLDEALAWCRAHRPTTEPPAGLAWGDVRLGNVIFDEDRRPVAVLDWEMASIGPAEHDLGWFLALEGLGAELVGRRVPGFPPRHEVVAGYEARLGRPVSDLDWYETFAMVRSAAIMTRLAVLAVRAGRQPMLAVADNPVLDVLDRRIQTAGAGR